MRVSEETVNTIWTVVWFLIGTYFAVAAVGGSHSAGGLALLCGYVAGRCPT
jgi:hypothetical protein